MHLDHRARVLSSFGAGLLVGTVSEWWSGSVPFAVVGGWVMAATTFLAIAWSSVLGRTAEQTRLAATAEDDTRTESGVLLLASAFASLGGVVFGLARAQRLAGWHEVVLTSLSVLGVALSWSVVHTVFMLRYAHEYYAVSGGGGVNFGENAPPDFLDFAYLAFTIGMTFQVSDT